MINSSTLPIVDVHCHPFSPTGKLTAREFTDAVAFPGGGVEFMAEGGVPADDVLIAEIQQVRRDTVYFRYLVRQLAGFFDCEPVLEQVLAARNEAVKDYRGYITRLYEAVGLTTLVADFGYPLPPVDVAGFRQDVGVEVVPVYRIEPLIAELLKSDCGWAEFRRRYDEAIVRALETEGFKGVKSIIAYRTGLEVSPLSRTPDQGLQALEPSGAASAGRP
ncbi:MAG: hypothetical protein HC875_03360 [Anaerolineales bacterium]|nr:hypothetical protein [Anaerolineales bacterium]